MSGPAIRVRRVGGAPVAAVRVLLPGGARVEETPGQALLAGRLLAEGTRARDWRAIATDAEDRGASVSSFAGYETTGVAIDALASDWELALDWAAELVLEPAFPADRLALLARQAAAELESQADQADMATNREFLEQLYAPHPRGRPLQGDAESLARATPASCRAFHRRALAQGAIVAVAGEIDERAAAAAIARRFAGLAAPDGVPPSPDPPPAPGRSRREVRTRAHDQAHLFIGRLTVPRAHPDHAALELAGVILGSGSGLTGRIPQRIREQAGLAYTASAEAVAGAGLDPGRLFAYVGTSPETVERAERDVIDELERFAREGPSAAEVEEARAFLLGREPFRRETARQWADLAAAGALLGLPLEDSAWSRDRIAALDRPAVLAAVARHLDGGRYAVTVGLPGEDAD